MNGLSDYVGAAVVLDLSAKLSAQLSAIGRYFHLVVPP